MSVYAENSSNKNRLTIIRKIIYYMIIISIINIAISYAISKKVVLYLMCTTVKVIGARLWNYLGGLPPNKFWLYGFAISLHAPSPNPCKRRLLL